MRLNECFFDKDEEEIKCPEDEGSKKGPTYQEIYTKMEEREKNKAWMPPGGRDKSLDLYIKLVKDDTINNLKRTSKSNTTEQER